MRARVAAAVLAASALVVGPLAAAHALVVPGPAVAVTGDDDGEAVVAVSETEGTWSGTLEVTNASGAVVELAVAAKSGLGDECAPPEVSPDQVEANRVQSVTIEVSCDVPDGGAVLVLTLGPDDNRTVDVTLDPETSEEPQWGWFLVVLAIAAVLALAPVLVVAGWWARLQVQKTGDDGLPRWKAATDPREPEPEDVDLSTPVTGAPSGWSFSESWASNFTAVLALLTALFGSADMLDAFLGEAPDGAEGQLLVAAAGAALLVGIAPLALKLVGPTSTPTVGGIALGAWLTLTGTFLQVLALVHVLADGPLALPATVLAFAVVLFLLGYAIRTLHQFFTEAFPTPGPEEPTTVSELLMLTTAVLEADGAAATPLRLKAIEKVARDYLDGVSAQVPGPSAPQSILPPGMLRSLYPAAVLGTSPGDLPSPIL